MPGVAIVTPFAALSKSNGKISNRYRLHSHSSCSHRAKIPGRRFKLRSGGSDEICRCAWQTGSTTDRTTNSGKHEGTTGDAPCHSEP
jgi:hypothetical protein